MVAGTFGKMEQPFRASSMVFDPDYTPEGAALQATYKINDQNSLAVQRRRVCAGSSQNFRRGSVPLWRVKPSGMRIGRRNSARPSALPAYDIANDKNLAAAATGMPYDSNLGNTITGRLPAPVCTNFNPIVASGSITYTLDSFPLYPGAFPVKLAGEYMNNPAAASNNKGWWGGVTLGKSGKKGAWDISYRYQCLEADAWWDQIVDDDNVAVFPSLQFQHGCGHRLRRNEH